MLRTLTVQNLVVVRHVDVEFGCGLTVLSGETGAGKSILIEALGLALGERADSALVRAGVDRATVTAMFDVSAVDAVQVLLREHDLDGDGECVLRRVVLRDGGSRAFCNSSPIAVQLMREIGELLVDVHAQHASQQLLRRDIQRMLLDAYGELEQPQGATRAAYQQWKNAHDQLAALSRANAERDRTELLRYQVDELAAARIDAAEISTIEEQYKRLANGAAHLELCAAMRQALGTDEDSIVSMLRTVASKTRTLAKRKDDAASLVELVDQSIICVEEALRELDRLESSIEIDPQRLKRLDDRMAALHTLARKHQLSMQELPALEARLEDALAEHDRILASRAALDRLLEAALADYQRCSEALSAARLEAIARMNADITQRMRELGLPHARFDATLERVSEQPPQAHGGDRVEFTVATNPDQPAGPINKVASGGELSRIGLAIQAATARHAGIPVVVYDEVDTGIGGTTANIVGRALREVARHSQVICITHSPQVASAGDHHILVSKVVHDGTTETLLSTLDRDARETEIARMLGAAAATTASVAHARDLIATATGD